MKLHVYHHPDTEPLGGAYTSVCIATGSLDIAEDAEVTELVANDILEYIPLTQLNEFLAAMITKLRHGGTMIITGVDSYSVAKDYVAHKLSIEDFNILIHGYNDSAREGHTDSKCATLALQGLVSYLKTEFGLKIVRQGLEDYKYMIEVQRP